MTGSQSKLNNLKLYQKKMKEQIKDLKEYDKRSRKILMVENYQRESMLEYLFEFAYPVKPPMAGKPMQISIQDRDKTQKFTKKAMKVDKAIMKLYTLPIRRVNDLKPDKFESLAGKK